jgi:hypothetical protein
MGVSQQLSDLFATRVAGSEWPEAALITHGRRIRIAGYRLDKAGRLVKCSAHRDVSARLRERSSKRIRVVRTLPY